MLSSGYFLFPSNMKVFCLSLLLDGCGKTPTRPIQHGRLGLPFIGSFR
jgi:hypothetical protein